MMMVIIIILVLFNNQGFLGTEDHKNKCSCLNLTQRFSTGSLFPFMKS